MNVSQVVERIVGAPASLEVLKLKPGRRRTARARGPKGSAIVKVYASGRAAVVASRVASLAAGPEEPLVPAVLHVDPGLRLVVLSDLPGRPLREALLDGDLATCARVGRVLGSWHAAWHGKPPRELRPHTVAREAEILRRRCEAASPAVARAVEHALPHLTGDWESTTVAHRDLYEEQVLTAERVGLIDLDDAAAGPPELDLGNLLAHVELLELRRARVLSRERTALVDAYAETGPELDEALLARCRRLSLLRLACLNDDFRLAEATSVEGAPA